jgi:hypothetical protein
MEEVTRSSCKVAAAFLAHGMATSTDESPQAGDQPKWASKVHKSHDAWFGAGLVFCKKCGFIAAGGRKNLGIFEPCRWSTEGIQIPEGSRNRRDRTNKGKHPDCTAKTWPDGRCAKVKVRMEKVTWKSQDTGTDAHQQNKKGSELEEGESTEEERLEAETEARRKMREMKYKENQKLRSKVQEPLKEVIRKRMRRAAAEAKEEGQFDRNWFSDLDITPVRLGACMTTEMQSEWWDDWSEQMWETRLGIEEEIAEFIEDLEGKKVLFRRMSTKKRQQA